MAAESGIRSIQAFDTSDLATKIAGEVPQATRRTATSTWTTTSVPKEQRKSTSSSSSNRAAQQAVEDSGWMPQDEEALDRTGVMIGSGIGGLQTIYDVADIEGAGAASCVSPFFIPRR